MGPKNAPVAAAGPPGPATPPSHPIDHGWAWVICFGSFMANFFVTGGMRTIGLIFVELMKNYRADASLTGFVIALIAGGFAIFSAIGNAVGMILTMRKACLVGAVFTFLGMFLTCFAPNIYVVILTMGLMTGIGYGFLFGPSMVLVGQYFNKRRSLANGLAVSGGSVGQLLLPLFIDAVIKRYTFQGALLFYSALILHTIPACLLLRPTMFYDKPPSLIAAKAAAERALRGEDPGDVTDAVGPPSAPPRPRGGAALAMFCRKLCDPALVCNGVFSCFACGIMTGHGGYINTCLFLPPYVLQLYGAELYHRASILIAVMGVADGVGRIAGGMFSDLGLVPRPYIVGFSFVIAGVATILMPFMPSFPILIGFGLVFGLLGGTYMAQLGVILADLFGLAMLPSGLGLSTLSMGLFIIPLPSILGKLRSTTGTFSTPIRFSGMLLILGGVLFLLIPTVKRIRNRRLGLSSPGVGDNNNNNNNTTKEDDETRAALTGQTDWSTLKHAKESDL